jgi:U3 small nucleolar RNA-associated protein MPP10
VSNNEVFSIVSYSSSLGLLYQEFFDPPPGLGKSESPRKSKSTTVRFHDEVKIKNIKAKGKQLPVGTAYYWDEEDNGDDDFGEYMSDDEDDDDEAEDEDIAHGGSDKEEKDGSESENEDVEELDGGRDAIERLKDDLFDDDEAMETGFYMSPFVLV